MNKSAIEWTEFTSNPVKGKCPIGCYYCYVKAFRKRYGWPDEISFHPNELEAIRKRKKSSRIFMGSTIELFHDDTIIYMPEIMKTVRSCPQHTFMFLTKQPQNLTRFSPFPKNCWFGVTATGYKAFNKALDYLKGIEAKIKFISFEPLLEAIPFYQERLAYCGINWLIIGAQTNPYKPPKRLWVDEITEACKRAGIPYFLKDNLRPLLGNNLVQEMPK